MTESMMDQREEMSAAELSSPLLDLFKSVVTAHGLELRDVEIESSTLTLFVDRPGGSVDLDTLVMLSKEISSAMDNSAFVDRDFLEMTLEVSTPGVERTLKRREHYKDVLGSMIAIKLQGGRSGRRRLLGRLLDVSASGITLMDSSAPLGSQEIFVAFADIERAHTVFEWKRDLVE